MCKKMCIVGACGIFLGLSGLLYWAVPDSFYHFDRDSYGYDRIATTFQKTNSLHDPSVRGGIPIQPVGYPLTMGIVYKLVGYAPMAVIWLQIIIALLSLLLLFSIAKRLFSESVARIALVLGSCNLGFLVYAQLLLAEILLVFMILLFFERLTAFWRDMRLGQVLSAGGVLGLSVLIKPMGLIYIIFLIPFIWLCIPRSYWFRTRAIMGMLMAFYVPLLGCMSYNYMTFGYFRYAPMTSLNIYQCFLSKVIADVEHLPVEPVRTQMLAFTGKHGFDESGWDNGRALFMQYAHTYPLTMVRVWLQNVIKTLLGLYATQLKVMFNKNITGGDHSFFKLPGSFFDRFVTYISGGSAHIWLQLIAWLEVVWSLIRFFLIGLACWVLLRKKRFCLLYLLGSFVLQSALVTGIDGCCRYRVTFEPILIILTAVGLVCFVRYVRTRTFY